jgi:hypothetical protein
VPFIDKLFAKMMPVQPAERLARATAQARTQAAPGGWLELVLDHHDQVRLAFEAARLAPSAGDRLREFYVLWDLLIAHAVAETLVIYPAFARVGRKPAAVRAYAEASYTAVQMAELDRLDPASSKWLGKLEALERPLLQHFYREETAWFLSVIRNENDGALRSRYEEEYERYFHRAGERARRHTATTRS